MSTAINEMIDTYQPLVDGIAAEYGRKYRRWGGERADFAQEMWEWIVKHPNKLDQWAEETVEDEKGFTRLLARSLRRVATKYGQSLKAQATGYEVDDLHWYSPGELKLLLDSVYDEEAWLKPPIPEGDAGRGRQDPATGGNWVAILSDVSRAVGQLPEDDRVLLELFHREGWTNIMLAEYRSVTPQAMSAAHKRSLERLADALGGERPKPVHDTAENGFCECGWVGRRAVSNAAARAQQDNYYQET